MTNKQREAIFKLEKEYDKEYTSRGLSGKLEEIEKRLKSLKRSVKSSTGVVGSR